MDAGFPDCRESRFVKFQLGHFVFVLELLGGGVESNYD
jgi:hypothetical protein